jgi:hypothetical protein
MQELSTEKNDKKTKRKNLSSFLFWAKKKDSTRQSDSEIDDGAERISASSLECLY